MNKVILIGNLTDDPEVRYTTDDRSAVAKFSVAINDGYGEKQKTSYPRIVCFGKTAENCEKYLSKGRKVAIEGRIQTGSYVNKKGDKVYTTDVIADRVEFLPSAEKTHGQKWTEEDGGFPF